MRKITKQLSTLALSAVFASMQVAFAGGIADFNNAGFGNGVGGAEINKVTGGLVDIDVTKPNTADLNFNGDAHVNWNTLNLNTNDVLNFNSADKAANLTILNTVNNGMSNIYGTINANEGIGKFILSNPNGVLFDGAHFFSATGDMVLTTKDLSNISLSDLSKLDLSKENYSVLYGSDGKLITLMIKDSDFDVAGEYHIYAPAINVGNSTLKANTVKMVTANGQDFLNLGIQSKTPKKYQTVTKLNAVTINGDLYITNDVGALEMTSGGTVNGNTTINTAGDVCLNEVSNKQKLAFNGDVDVKGNGAQMFLRNADVKGNLKMYNGGGFLDVGNVNVTKDVTLETGNDSQNALVRTDQHNSSKPIKHFVHVIGDNTVGGNMTINSENNIHIGNYNYAAKQLLDGSLDVKGDLTAHARNGHVMTTVDTSANKISLKSDTLNVLTDGKAVLKANEYEFSSNGYIGGLVSDDTMTVDEKVIAIMENYKYIPDRVGTPGYVNIAGGTISKIETPKGASTYISSNENVKLTGANAGLINIKAPGKFIEIEGNNVHADTITVGKETDKLKVEFPNRDYTLKYTNIRDAKEVTINKNEEVTYELTNGDNGYNTKSPRPANTTYLVGPDKPVTPDTPDTPDTPVVPDTPDTPVTPNPVQPQINPDDTENVRVLDSYRNQAVDLNQVYTPVAYAADLDDDEKDIGVRKNVDGSVTVVRAFPMIN